MICITFKLILLSLEFMYRYLLVSSDFSANISKLITNNEGESALVCLKTYRECCIGCIKVVLWHLHMLSSQYLNSSPGTILSKGMDIFLLTIMLDVSYWNITCLVDVYYIWGKFPQAFKLFLCVVYIQQRVWFVWLCFLCITTL